jgi:hypothetical protein
MKKARSKASGKKGSPFESKNERFDMDDAGKLAQRRGDETPGSMSRQPAKSTPKKKR